MKTIVILATLVLLSLFGCNQDNPTPTPQSYYSTWTGLYGDVAQCDNFDFGQPHYCVKTIPAQVGQSITITFTMTGAVVPTEGAPPARLRLFLWRRGDAMTCAGPFQQYRYWGTQDVILEAGTHTLTVKIAPENFTDCYGKPGSDFPANFAATVADLQAVGFTFGGTFAGHGVTGTGHFHLDDFHIAD